MSVGFKPGIGLQGFFEVTLRPVKRLRTDPPQSYRTDPPLLQTHYIQPPATSRSSMLFSYKQQEFSHFNIASCYIILDTMYL